MILPANRVVSDACIKLFTDAVQDDMFDVRVYIKERSYLTNLSRLDQITVLSWFSYYVTVNQVDKTWTVRPMVKWKYENGEYDKIIHATSSVDNGSPV